MVQPDLTAHQINTVHPHIPVETLQSIETLVNIDSSTWNPGGVELALFHYATELKHLGFTTQRHDLQPITSDWLRDLFHPGTPESLQLTPLLLATIDGTSPQHVLLLGHIDTAFPVGAAERNSFRIEGRYAYGCAVADMKSGLIVMLAAVRALIEHNRPRPKITMIINTDEQAGSIASRSVIESLVIRDRPDACLCAERGQPNGALIDRQGALGVGWIHASPTPADAARDALPTARLTPMLETLIQVQERSRQDVDQRINVGEVRTRLGVDGTTRIDALVDLRARTNREWNESAKQVEDIAKKHSTDVMPIEVRLHLHRPAMEPTQHTSVLRSIVENAAMNTRQLATFIETPGGSDAGIVAQLDVPTIDAWGPVGANTMSDTEYIELDTLLPRISLMARTLELLAVEPSTNARSTG